MAMAAPYDPHAHVADLEALFNIFHVSGTLPHCPHTQPHHPHQLGGTGSAKTHGGARTTTVVLALHIPPSLWGGVA